MVLNVAAGDDPDHPIRWSFDGRPRWSPRLELEMDSEVANAYLQGRESLAIAMARRRVRCRGEARVALLYLPAIRLICEPYRRDRQGRVSAPRRRLEPPVQIPVDTRTPRA